MPARWTTPHWRPAGAFLLVAGANVVLSLAAAAVLLLARPPGRVMAG